MQDAVRSDTDQDSAQQCQRNKSLPADQSLTTHHTPCASNQAEPREKSARTAKKVICYAEDDLHEPFNQDEDATWRP